MKRKFFTTATLLVCSVIICLAAIIDLTGKWSGSLKIPSGEEFPLTYTFKADGAQLTGNVQSPQGELPITDGKIDGDNFTFKVSLNGSDIINTGKYYGDSVSMNIEYNGTKLHSTLKRADK
jgi:hypothetical protein